jgi:hypothetical protein
MLPRHQEQSRRVALLLVVAVFAILLPTSARHLYPSAAGAQPIAT